MDGISDGAEERAWQKVGAELRRLRADLGMSLSELARQVHYSTGYLSKIETGKKRATAELARLADEVWRPAVCWRGCCPRSNDQRRTVRSPNRSAARPAPIRGWPLQCAGGPLVFWPGSGHY